MLIFSYICYNENTMNYLILIIVAVAGIALGAYFARRKGTEMQTKSLQPDQVKQKAENKDKVLTFVQKNREVKNGDVEKMLSVSDATAERYLNELEKEGKIKQHGVIGQNVFYTPK